MQRTVLVIEDNDSIREAIQAVLENDGFSVKVAIHGRDGLEILKRIPSPCVILLDLQMPQMNGYEFLIEKNRDPSLAPIPVVLVSANADNGNLDGVAAIIRKPFDIFKLLAIVEGFCRQPVVVEPVADR